jgi:uncharacterized protein (TIGR03437 family)
MIRFRAHAIFAAVVFGFAPGYSARAQNVITFDFDSGSPVLSPGQGTPFQQTVGGVTAAFTSPTLPAFSIQSERTTSLKLSRFSGNYLYDNDLNRSVLEIRFSQLVTNISFDFATADFEVEVPTDLEMTAYLDSSATPAVGSTRAHGTYGNDAMPMGTLAFESSGRPFNIIQITIPFSSSGTTVFHIDQINITTAPESKKLWSVSAASYMNWGVLARGSIATGFGENLSAGTAWAVGSPPLTLAGSTVTLKDSSGLEYPAPLFYVGPGQINYLIPEDMPVGPASVTVRSGGELAATGAVDVTQVAPSLFTANSDGTGPPAASAVVVGMDSTQSTQPVASCGTAIGSCVASPIDLGPEGTQVVLVLYGTGIRGRGSLLGVKVTMGNIGVEVQYAGAQSQYVGLDQVNATIPRALAGRGEVDVTLAIGTQNANTVRIKIK